MTISDGAPGEVHIHVVCDPPLSEKGDWARTPAQKIALALFSPHLAALAGAPPYPKVWVRINDHPDVPVDRIRE
jgi:hypothetical protein